MSWFTKSKKDRRPFREQVKDLLEAYRADLEKDQEAPVLWIFRSLTDQDEYVRAIEDLIEEARGDARRERMLDIVSRVGGEDCACTCKAHGKAACSHCLNVLSCPVHDDPDPETVRPNLLLDPVAVAQALYSERMKLRPDISIHVRWENLKDGIKQAEIEVARRIVTARIKRRKPI